MMRNAAISREINQRSGNARCERNACTAARFRSSLCCAADFCPFQREQSPVHLATRASYASKYTPMEFESAGVVKLYLPCAIPPRRPSPNSGLIIRIIVLIPRQSFVSPFRRFRSPRIDCSVHLRASQRGARDGSSSASTGNSDSHLHLRSFPALSLCSRPFSRPLSIFLSLSLLHTHTHTHTRSNPRPRPDLNRPVPRG